MDISSYYKLLVNPALRTKLVTQKAISIFDIDFKILKEAGVNMLILDVDDTLSGHLGKISNKIFDLLTALNKDFKIAVVSNATKTREKYLRETFSKINCFVSRYPNKPSKKGFTEALNYYNYLPGNAAVIGDRIGTDIFGAYSVGIKHRILVEPYSIIFNTLKSPVWYKLIRYIEKKIYL